MLKVIGGFLLGAICGAALALGLSIAAAEIFNISQMEGAYAMGVVFMHMPFGALIGGIVGAVWLGIRHKARS